jgi:hypothetical protein
MIREYLANRAATRRQEQAKRDLERDRELRELLIGKDFARRRSAQKSRTA